MNEGATFCKECGTSVTNQSARAASPPTPPAKPMNPKTKKLVLAGVIFLGVLIGGYKIGENLTSKDRIIEKVETVLIEKDKDKLADLLVSTDKKLKVDKDSLEGLMKYLNENPDKVQEIVETLKEQSKYYDKIKNNSKSSQQYIEDTMSSGLFNLHRNGKTLFYDKYEITIKPTYLSLSTNYQNTILMVNGKEVAKANQPDYSKTVGPFLPGYYTVEAKLKNDFVTLKNKEEILVGEEDKQEVNLYLDGEEVTIYSDIEDDSISGKVLLNGKELKINPFALEPFGPVVTDGSLSMQVIANLPWGEMKSGEFVIDDESIEFDLAGDETFQQTIMDTLVTNAREWIVAYTSGDATKMTTNSLENTQRLAESISSAKEDGTYFKGTYNGTSFDLDSLSLYKEDDQWRASIDVTEFYNSDFYYAEETPELTESTQDWTYYLVYDEEKKNWFVDDNEEHWGLDEENLVEHVEESPKQYTSVWAN